jgi:uncharacterized coiled-coil DUF342 family protein
MLKGMNMDATQLLAQLTAKTHENMSLRAKIKALEHKLETAHRTLASVTSERDTYAEGLHQLKAEMFQARMIPYAQKAQETRQ